MDQTLLCHICGGFYSSLFYTEHIQSDEHCKVFESNFSLIESAAKCRIVTLFAGNPKKFCLIENYLEWLRDNVIYLLKTYLENNGCMKYNMILECVFNKDDSTEKRAFKTSNVPVFKMTNLNDQYSFDIQKLTNEFRDLEHRGSGWSLLSITGLELRINKYEPLTGGCRKKISILPQYVLQTRSCVNPFRTSRKVFENSCCRNKCFQFAILGEQLFKRGINYNRILNYFKYPWIVNKYNWSCIQYPVKLDDISIFENANYISINVYSLDTLKKLVYPIKVTNTRKADHRDILLFKNHYCWIKNLGALVSHQILRKRRSKLHICRQCFQHFYKIEQLLTHERFCKGDPIVTMPDKTKSSICFKNYNFKLKIPYTIFLDIKYDLEPKSTCFPNPSTSFVHVEGTYEPISYSYYVLYNGKIMKHTESHSFETMLQTLQKECYYIHSEYKKCYPPSGTLVTPQNNDLCHICSKPMFEGDFRLDHDHLSKENNIRGYAHNRCNLNYRLPMFVPILVKDLAKINSFTILKSLIKQPKGYVVKVIPFKSSGNQFLSITLRSRFHRIRMKFIDFSQFLNCQGEKTIDLIEKLEKFRTVCYENYKIDLLYYTTIGTFAWDAMLLTTGVNLQLLEDEEMYDIFQKGIRGGMVGCIKKYAASNNLKLPHLFNKHLPTSYIFLFDVIGLYSKIMMDCPLPLGNFQWVENPNSLNVFESKGGLGYILEVDLKYPLHLQEKHWEFPLCPQFVDGIGLKGTFIDKYNYIIHHEALKQALNFGLILVKIHRAVSFEESCWLRPFIKLNNELRKKYNSDKTLNGALKTLSNVIYGKSLERLQDRSNVHILISNPKKLIKLIKQPSFCDRTILSEDCYIVYMKKRKVENKKPNSLGFAILDLSKVHMFDIFYNELKKKFPFFELLYFDTDSFLIQVYCEDSIENHLKQCSNFLHLDQNLGEPGLMRDQYLNDPIIDYIGLRSKVYSIRSMKNFLEPVKKNLPPTFNIDMFNNISMLKELRNTGQYIKIINDKLRLVTVSKRIPDPQKDTKIYFQP